MIKQPQGSQRGFETSRGAPAAMEPDQEAAPLLPPGVTKRQSKLVLKCFAGLVVLLLVLVFAVWLPAAGKADIPDRHRHPGHKRNTSLPVVRSGIRRQRKHADFTTKLQCPLAASCIVLRGGAGRMQLHNGLHITMLHDEAADMVHRFPADVTSENHKDLANNCTQVLWHGMGDSCCASYSIGYVADLIADHLGGVPHWR